MNSSLNAWQVVEKITGKEDLMWVNVFYCPRKEQVGEKLASILGWNTEQLNTWNNLNKDTDYFEKIFDIARALSFNKSNLPYIKKGERKIYLLVK